MALDGKSDSEVAALGEKLISKLRELGGFSRNVKLQRSLNWDEPLYWVVRNRIYDRGLLTLGRGRGGSVTLVEKALAGALPEAPVAQITNVPEPSETAFYAPIADVLRKNWVRDYRLRQSLVEVTALQGRRSTGGAWTRPDVVVIEVRILPICLASISICSVSRLSRIGP